MRVLIGCEESQVVTKEFRKLGHEAYSCDILPCSGGRPEWHLQMDVMKAIDLEEWDFIGLHPVCTKMTLSGNRHYAPGKPKHSERLESVEWTIKLWEKACSKSEKVYMENPMGALNSDVRLKKPQIIHPYYFGDEYQKTTCLWLYNLPFLFHSSEKDLFNDKITHVSKGEIITFKSGKSMPKWYAETPSTNSEHNRKKRSKTFPGIARALATQWSEYLKLNYETTNQRTTPESDERYIAEP